MTTLQFFDEAKKAGTTVPTMECPVCHASHVPLEKSTLSDGVYACTCQNCGHFFKFKARGPVKSDVTLKINGKPYKVGSDVSATTSLNEYLRSLGLRGTKYMCYQGGCGLCLVCVKLYEPITMKPQTYAINSCLCPVLSCDGWEVTTIEGLGSPQDGLHPIQERLADHNGSQCGFCSPGQVMNMYGLMAYNQDLGQKFTMKQVEDAFDATICRCTGYRAILDAMKSFASDAPPPGGHVDIEDLDKKLCKKTGQACSGTCGHHGDEACPPSRPPALHLVLGDAQWFRPATLKELYALVQQNKDSGYRLTFGNTAGAVYGDMGSYGASVLIDMRGIRELYSVSFDPTWQLGANVSLSQLLDVFTRMKSDVSLKYFVEFEAHTRKIASTSVRNMACWTGNLMMKRQHPEFVSDIFVMFETIGTQLWIGHADGTDDEQVSLTDFLKMDMKGKVILGAFLPTFVSPDVYIKTYKVSRRTQNAHAHVSAGFFFRLDKSNNYLVKAKPSIVYTGISPTFNHASKTEAYLQGKQLGDPAVLKGALAVLQSEVVPTVDPAQASPIYRRSLALALFYKFVLACCPDKVDARFQSGASTLSRPVHTASHSFDTDPSEFPVSKPMTKRDATLQTSGVLQYTNDVPPQPDELYAAFVLSTVASAKILSIDASAALKIPGVVNFISAENIPKGGINNCMPAGAAPVVEEVFCSGQVQYCGQAVGLIIATSVSACFGGVAAVKVNYSDVQPPILTIQDAIAKNSFFPNAGQEVKVGDAEAAIKSSPKTIKGSISMGGQYHFQMETHISICTPTDEGGVDVQAATQWIDFVQIVVAQVLNIPVNKVNVETRRLGGAYGSKITRNFPVSAACALAAYIMRRPVRLSMPFSTNMKMVGTRVPYMANYEIGLSDTGKLNGVKIEYFANCGITPNDTSLAQMSAWIDNAYFCPNWHLTPRACKTNLPVMTAARSPGSCPAIFIMESIMEHAAKALDMDPTALRKLNFIQNGQKTPVGFDVENCTLQPVYDKLNQLVDLATRQQQVDAFNKANRWKKRGCSVVPIKFGIGWAGAIYSVLVNVYHGDGSVAVAHGGIESGQGINTKVAQVVAYELGIPLDLIQIKKSSTMANANSITTGGSITSELNCMGAIECCKQLKARMAPVKAKMVNPTWKDLVAKCYAEGVDLVAQYSTNPPADPGVWHYCCYGATYCETELDVLTGEREILRSDMVYDCGVSLNPEIDVGQAEGAYVMGLGYFLQEELVYDTQTGANLTATTWEYKPPLHQDTPDQLNITLLPRASNPVGVLRSKAVGEPPLTMSCGALFALKHAAMAARAEISKNDFFPLNAPATVEMLQRSSLVEPDQFVFGK